MGVAAAIREARVRVGLKQEDLAPVTYLSPKTISAIENDRRKLPPDAAARLSQYLDDPRVYMEVAEEVTGGVFVSPWLDGEVDLHRSSIRFKLLEELEEILGAMKAVPEMVNARSGDQLTEGAKVRLKETMLQALDARVAIDHFVAVTCSTYGFSVRQLYRDHRRKLEGRRYIKKRNLPEGR